VTEARSGPPQPDRTGEGDELIAGLLARARRASRTPAAVELIETHISWVLLTGPYAYKIKKPVRLPFLDFTSLEARHFFCAEELRLNRRLAPELYLAVVPIGGTRDAPRLEHEPAIEYAVKMRQFDAGDRLDRVLEAGSVGIREFARFAARLALFHAALPAAPSDSDFGTAGAVGKIVLDNVAELAASLVAAPDAALCAALGEWTRQQCEERSAALAARRAADAIKEGHGDLHLENLALIDGRILPFDALEFDPRLRWGDVVGEAAFLAMDLMAHARDDLAFGFIDEYLIGSGDYDGAALLRFYLVYRAAVRAKIGAIKAAQHCLPLPQAARRYLELASTLAQARAPLLVITSGVSGSGKTHLTNELLGRLPALRVRSDIERKRLHGRAPTERHPAAVGAGIYGADDTARTYRRLEEAARACLLSGFDVIVDATFLAAAQRQVFAQLARATGARFVVLACAASPQRLRARIAERAALQHDASEATEAVLDAQLRHAEPLGGEELANAKLIDTEQPIDYSALAAALRRRAASQ
jgi:uncharacterized protein